MGGRKTIFVDDKKFTLFPIGNVKERVQRIYASDVDDKVSRRGRDSESGALDILSSKLAPISIGEATFGLISKSYIDHYKAVLGEEWSAQDFIDRLVSLSYRTFKYARDESTGKVHVVGFFGAQIATGAGGKYLTNAELYVLPQFRGLGIATELVNQSFELAHRDGINGFDSLTYRVKDFDPLTFWEKIGAECTELHHIAGDIDIMMNNISQLRQPSQDEQPRIKA